MVHVLETGLEYMEIDNPTGKPAVRGYNIINGQLTSASDASTFTSTNPAHLADCLGEFPLSTRDDVRDALHAAHAAFPAWAATPAPTRGQIIGNMGRLLMEHKDALVALETRGATGARALGERWWSGAFGDEDLELDPEGHRALAMILGEEMGAATSEMLAGLGMTPASLFGMLSAFGR